MTLNEVSFPVFKLGQIEPLFEHGVRFYLQGRDIEYSDAEYRIKIVDDTNIDKPTLALRRLELYKQNKPLYKIGQAVFFIGDLIKLSKTNPWFIDTQGTVFQYVRRTRVKLVYKPLEKITPIKTGGAIVEVRGISARFKTLFMPTDYPKFAGLLVVGNSYILYGLYDKEYSSSWRII